jgi:hypothetical protein
MVINPSSTAASQREPLSRQYLYISVHTDRKGVTRRGPFAKVDDREAFPTDISRTIDELAQLRSLRLPNSSRSLPPISSASFPSEIQQESRMRLVVASSTDENLGCLLIIHARQFWQFPPASHHCRESEPRREAL